MMLGNNGIGYLSYRVPKNENPQFLYCDRTSKKSILASCFIGRPRGTILIEWHLSGTGGSCYSISLLHSTVLGIGTNDIGNGVLFSGVLCDRLKLTSFFPK